MKITKANYEAFAMDYLEGNLSDEMKSAFKSFLILHPEIASELECLSIELPESQEDKTVASFRHLKKESFSKEHQQMNWEELLIAKVEGELSPEESSELDLLINNNESLKRDWQITHLTKLMPEADITFPNKKTLYRKAAKIIVFNRMFYAAAASVLMIISLGIYFLMNNSTENENNVAVRNPTPYASQAIENTKLSEETTASYSDKNNTLVADNNTGVEDHSKRQAKTKETDIITAAKENIELNSILSEVKQENLVPITSSNEMSAIANEQTEVKSWLDEQSASNELKPIKRMESKNEFINVQQFVLQKMASIDNENIEYRLPENSKINTRQGIRYAGIGLVNKVLKRDIKIKEDYNDNGELASRTIVAGRFEYHRSR
jgi:hypothetical protein